MNKGRQWGGGAGVKMDVSGARSGSLLIFPLLQTIYLGSLGRRQRPWVKAYEGGCHHIKIYW